MPGMDMMQGMMMMPGMQGMVPFGMPGALVKRLDLDGAGGRGWEAWLHPCAALLQSTCMPVTGCTQLDTLLCSAPAGMAGFKPPPPPGAPPVKKE